MDPAGPSNVAEGAECAELVDLSQDGSSDLSPGRSHPAIKRLKRAHTQSAGSPGRGGRPHSTLWDLFDKSERKQNVCHYTANCICCTTVGMQSKGVTGKAEDMRVHLIKCQHAFPQPQEVGYRLAGPEPAICRGRGSASQFTVIISQSVWAALRQTR